MMQTGGPKPSSGYVLKKSTKTMEQFASELENAVNDALPLKVKPYNGVYVLSLRWSNDDMNLGPLENDLCEVFTKVYGYTVEKHLIQATNSEYDTRLLFRQRITQFVVDYNKTGNLLIVVYAGHGSRLNSSGEYLLVGRRSPAFPTLDWITDAAPSINNTPADVLIIMDSCYASSAAVKNVKGPEVLAASTWETSAGAVASTSFTQHLINELKRLNGKSSSVASIYGQIHHSTKPATSIKHCPLHVAKVGRDSIILAKLEPATPRNQTIIGPLKPNDERVIVTVHLAEDYSRNVPDVQQWTTWLTTNMPSNVSKTQVKVEGVFDSNSVVILVSMPIEVWTMLPDGDEAYTFVSFVKSGNRLLERQPTLPMHNTKENKPMTSPFDDRRDKGGFGGPGGFGSAGGIGGGGSGSSLGHQRVVSHGSGGFGGGGSGSPAEDPRGKGRPGDSGRSESPTENRRGRGGSRGSGGSHGSRGLGGSSDRGRH